MILYLETSNLVKLYVAEPDTSEIRRLVEEAEIVASSIIAYPETRAALARKLREGGITEREYRRIKREFISDWEKYLVMLLTKGIAKSAGDLAEKHVLRGFDALHLASVLALKSEMSSPVCFSSADRRLCRAAEKEGF